jgi:hypothetical protein
MRRISLVAEDVLGSQQGLCSTELQVVMEDSGYSIQFTCPNQMFLHVRIFYANTRIGVSLYSFICCYI